MGRVRSQVGVTTRNLDHANHAQNRFVARPSTGSIVPPWEEDEDAFLPDVLLDGWEKFDAEWWKR